MVKILSRILDFVGIEESDDRREQDDYEQRGRYDERMPQYDRYEERARNSDRSRFEERARYEERDDRYSRGNESSRRKGGKVVNHPSAMDPQHHMRIYQMEDYDDARTVIDDLLSDRSVLINLELVDVDVSQRIVDMLSGATYALGASLKKAAANTYLLAPMSVDVSGSYEEEERRKGGSFFGGSRR